MEVNVYTTKIHNRSTCLPTYNSQTPVIIAVNVLVCAGSIFGNTLLIVSLVKFRRLHSTTNFFVASLAASDLLVGYCIPYYILFYFDLEWACDFYPCLVRYSLMLYATFLSLLSVVGVAVDRYIAIFYPLSYHTIITSKRAKHFILIGWIYLALISLLPFGVHTWNPTKEMTCDLFYIVALEYVLGTSVSHLLLAIFITMTAYGCIFREALKQRRAVAIQESHSLDLQVRLRRERRITVTMVLVFCITMFGMVPYLISIMLRYTDWASQECWCKLKQVTVCFYLGKSCVNPIIYGWRNAEFRSAFAKLLRLKRNKPPEEHSFATIGDPDRAFASSPLGSNRTLREF